MMPALTSSDGRTKLCAPRLDLITAFLDHDPGEPGHGGAARAATTSGLPVDTASPPPLVSLPSASDPDRAAVVLILKAQHAARRRDTEKPPPRYYGIAYNVMPPRLRSAEPRGLVSDARWRSTQPKGPFRIGNASITARTPRPPNGPTGSPAQARPFSGGRTATDGTGPGLASTDASPPS